MFRRAATFAALASAALASAALTMGCQVSPSPGDPSYKGGALGNGGFAFLCDDSVACDRWSGSATKFPQSVALGSNFEVFFIPKDTTFDISVNYDPPPDGTTIAGVGDSYINRGPEGLTAVKAGYGTIAAKDADGSLIDYTTIEIVPPDALVIYDGNYNGSSPSALDQVSMKVGAERSFRALARSHGQDLAGALRYEWTSSAPDVLKVERIEGSKVTVTAESAGTATIEVKGGTFTQSFPVEVAQ